MSRRREYGPDGRPQWSENDPGYRARSAGYLARASSGGVLLTDVLAAKAEADKQTRETRK